MMGLRSTTFADLARSIGKGLFAGMAGTAAMTISSTVETKLRGRKPSDAPAEAAAKVLGVSPIEEKKRSGTRISFTGDTTRDGVP